MQHDLITNDTELTVVATAVDEDGRARLTLDETVWEATLTAAGAHRVTVRTDTGRRDVWAAHAPDGVWIWLDGCARLVQDAETVRSRRRGTGGGLTRDVTPPMPAVVTKLLVSTGDDVDKGQGLVVVSAMKMEMTLVALFAGTVQAIHAEQGAKVSPGDILVDIAPTEPDSEEQDG